MFSGFAEEDDALIDDTLPQMAALIVMGTYSICYIWGSTLYPTHNHHFKPALNSNDSVIHCRHAKSLSGFYLGPEKALFKCFL